MRIYLHFRASAVNIVDMDIEKEFISEERRKFKWQIGRTIASSLSGFLAGLIVAAILFFAFFNFTLKY